MSVPATDTPIQRQLMGMLMGIGVLVVVVTSAAYLAYEVVTFRQSAVGQLSTLGEIVASNSTAALAFSNPDDAIETLSALRAEPHVIAATLFDAGDVPFASYPDGRGGEARIPGREGYRFEGGRLIGIEPVVEGDKRLGTLYIVSDLGALYDRLRLYAGIAALVMGASLLVAYVFSRRLQRQISQPILALAEVAGAVSQRQDFSVRAPRRGGAELGALTDAFNHMLERIDAQQEQVRASERSLATTLDSIADAVIATDTEGRVIRMNPVAEQLTGWTMKEGRGRPISQIFDPIHEETGERVESPVGRALREGTGVGVSNHTALTARDGTVRPIAHSSAPLRDTDGKVGGVVLVFRDQSEERRAQRTLVKSLQLEAQNLHMQEANRLKSEFLANMSHELRTPLNGILGFAEILHDGRAGAVTEDQKEYLGDILSSGRHLLQLINDVLDLSKVEAGKLDFRPEALNLPKLVKEVLAVLRTTIAAKSIRVITELDPDLAEVELDASRLKQVLYNYVSNALKFTPDGGTVVVRARPEPTPELFRLEVSDTGIGIAAEDLDRLFVEFQQLDAGAAKRHGGTGLGLALTKRLVEAQGGRVGVTSTLGQGSVFFAVLPRSAAGGKRVPDVRRPIVAATAGPTILAIEDDERDQTILFKTLVEAGFGVEVASTGAQAAERCRQRRFDAITLDLLLPDMSGLDVLRLIRSEGLNRDVPVVVVTVVAEKGSVGGFAVHDILAKPLEGPRLLSSLTRAGVSPEEGGSVLVVDDDAASLKLMATTLAQFGFRATVAADGDEGLRAARAATPRAVVLDLMMPGMDGFEFLGRLREIPACRGVPVIVWTVKDLSAEEHARLEQSAQTIVAKGTEPSGNVLEALETLIGAGRRGPATETVHGR